MFRFYKKKGWNNEITSFDVTIVSEGDLIARGGYWNGDQWQETENFGPGAKFQSRYISCQAGYEYKYLHVYKEILVLSIILV